MYGSLSVYKGTRGKTSQKPRDYIINIPLTPTRNIKLNQHIQLLLWILCTCYDCLIIFRNVMLVSDVTWRITSGKTFRFLYLPMLHTVSMLKCYSSRSCKWLMVHIKISMFFIVEIQEYCQFDTFEARCGRDEIVVMDTALYGRMNLGKHHGIPSVFTMRFQNSSLPTKTITF